MPVVSGRHHRWLQQAVKLAKANPNNRHKHAAILVSSGSVVAYGLNNERAAFYPSRHAEWAAVREHLDCKGTLYVARVSRSGHVGNSAPCSMCLETLLNYTEIRAVYFTLPEPYADKYELSTMRRSNRAPRVRVSNQR